MVWGRTKLLIWDYIFEPAKEIRITYAGKNPEKLYTKANELIRTIFNVPEGYVQEKLFNWEKVKDADRFEISWEVTKILDYYTYIVVEMDLSGFSAEGEGRASFRLKPRLITEYPQDTLWQQSIVYEMMRRMWHKTYYHHKRMEYLYLGRELIINFERSVKQYMEELRK